MRKHHRIAITAAAVGFMVCIAACTGSDHGYDLNPETPPQAPATATGGHLAYARCILTGGGVQNYGYSDDDNLAIWRMQRCRLLAPEPLGLTTTIQVQDCILQYGSWFASELEISHFPMGWSGSRALIAVETICAPSPPFGQPQN